MLVGLDGVGFRLGVFWRGREGVSVVNGGGGVGGSRAGRVAGRRKGGERKGVGGKSWTAWERGGDGSEGNEGLEGARP